MDINKKADKMLRHAIRSVTPEKPADDFVSSVMLKIEILAAEEKRQIVSKPLISWKGWVIIFITFSILFTLVFIAGPINFNFDSIYDQFNNFISSYLSIFLSRLFAVGMVILSILFLFQIWLISHRIGRIHNAGTES